MRNMSFSMTEPQFLDGSKTVTRRLGWDYLKPGDRVRAVRKAQGLKKGEHVVPLGVIEILDVRRERLDYIHCGDVAREGFPGMTPEAFVEMFCKAMRPCQPDWSVTRIEFRRTQ